MVYQAMNANTTIRLCVGNTHNMGPANQEGVIRAKIVNSFTLRCASIHYGQANVFLNPAATDTSRGPPGTMMQDKSILIESQKNLWKTKQNR